MPADHLTELTMEQFMMYQKACHFHDEEIANDILHTDNVAEIKKLGRKVYNDTGDAVLAECAVRDQIWGIGLSMGDPNRFERSKWRGNNLLGYALMLVREQL